MSPDSRPAGGPSTEQRDEAMTEGVKSLFLMNGGAVVALLAFLQAIWTTDKSLAKWVVCAMVPFAAGVFLAGCVQLFRYHASYSLEDGDRSRFETYRERYLGCAYGALAAFLVGVIVVLIGAWRSLP